MGRRSLGVNRGLWGRDWYLGLKEPGISTRSINVVDVATQRALGVCWVAW